MVKGQIHLIDLDFEFKLWKTRLELFIKEVDILRTRNIELQNRPKIEMLNEVELLVLDDHQVQIERFLKRIITQEQELQLYNSDFPIDSTHQFYTDLINFRRKMVDLTRVHYEKVDDIVKELGVDSI